MRLLLVLLTSMLVFTNCASSKKLDKILKKLDEQQGSIADKEREIERLNRSLDKMQAAYDEVQRRNEADKKRIEEYRGLFFKLKKLIDDGKLKLKLQDGKMVVILPSDVLFASGSHHLSERGIMAVKEITPLLASLDDKEFQVEGHTDNVPIYTVMHPTNWELAADRALNVLHTMIKAGMPAERISATSFGDSRPVQPNNTIMGQTANRRIEIVIVPNLRDLPGYDELKKIADKNKLPDTHPENPGQNELPSADSAGQSE